MDSRYAQARRREHARTRPLRANRARLAALGSLIAIAVAAATIVFGSMGGSGSHAPTTVARPSSASIKQHTTASTATPKPGTATVPILAYRVINVPPPQSSAPPALYVPSDEFSAQMDALKAAGWHAVTLNQLEAYWTRGVPLASGKPIVITFDGGYTSQYTNALPVLKRLGWIGVENIPEAGLAPAEGGLTDSQIRALAAAGWELDLTGASQPDLAALDPSRLRSELATERQTLRARYGAPVNWFSYPSGRYSPTEPTAVRAAGFVGSTTLVPGWASPQRDRFRLPRLQVLGGTTASQLLSQIAAAQQETSVPTASAGT